MAAPQKSSPRTSIRSGFHTLAPGTGEADGSLRLREKLFLIQNAMGGMSRSLFKQVGRSCPVRFVGSI